MQEATDRKLVEQTLDGVTEAFAELHRRHYPGIYRLAVLHSASTADAEDIAAETFVRAITYLPSFEFRGASIFPWLARICRNLAIDSGRRRQRHPLVSLETATVEGLRALLDVVEGGGVDPGEIAERNETRHLIHAAVSELTAEQEEAVILRYLADLPIRDIAQAMGRSDGAVKALLHRALVQLRKSLLDKLRAAEDVEKVRDVGNTSQERPLHYGR